jgi:hypothetical protein
VEGGGYAMKKAGQVTRKNAAGALERTPEWTG